MKSFAVKEKRSAPRGLQRSRFGYASQQVKSQQAQIHSILHSSGAQAKLSIGQPNDKYEQEADQVADQVMAMPDPKLQRQPENEEEEEMLQAKPLADQITPLIQRQAEPEEEEEELVQPGYDQEPEESTPLLESVPTRDAGELGGEEEEFIQPKSNTGTMPQVTPRIARDIQSIKGTGQPLPASERAFFEPRFRRSFSHVRVHNDNRAGLIARSINARAFTFRHDVVFGAGQYSPGTSSGRKLLVHELTHVVQQNGGIYGSKQRSGYSTMESSVPTPEPSYTTQPSRSNASKTSSRQRHETGMDDVQKRSIDVSRLRGQLMPQRAPGKRSRPRSRSKKVARSAFSGDLKILGVKVKLKKGDLYNLNNRWIGGINSFALPHKVGKLPNSVPYVNFSKKNFSIRDLLKDAESGSTLNVTTRNGPKYWHKSKFKWETIRYPKDYHKITIKKGGKKIRKLTPTLDKHGGPTVEETLDRLYTGKNKLSLENKLIIGAVAQAECGGRIGCVNAYDTAVISVGFKQVTLRYGTLQDTIDKAPRAFEKHGIQLSTLKTMYKFKGDTRVRRIKGVANPWHLRRPLWVLRFYAASMEDDVVRELVRRVLDSKKEVVSKLKMIPKGSKGLFLHKDFELVAILTQVKNNCPRCYEAIVGKTTKRVGRKDKIIPPDPWFEKSVKKVIEALRKPGGGGYGYIKARNELLGKDFARIIRKSYGRRGKWVGHDIWVQIRKYFRNMEHRKKIRILALELKDFVAKIGRGLGTGANVVVNDMQKKIQILLKRITALGVRRAGRYMVKTIEGFLATVKKRGSKKKALHGGAIVKAKKIQSLARNMEL